MLDPLLSANAVDHFREFFRDLTPEKFEAMDDDALEDYDAACWAMFYSFGDPRGWNGFDGLSELAKTELITAYEDWPGAEATQRQIDLAQLGEIPESARPVAPAGESANLAAWVEYFRRYLKDVGVKDVTLSSDDGEKFLAACRLAFEAHGDPKLWDGFDGLPEPVKYVLKECYRKWPGSSGNALDVPIH